MKKTILFGSCLLLAAHIEAQTLDQTTQAATIGRSYLFAQSTEYLDPAATTTGTGQVWDFSAATSAATDTVVIMDAAATPMGAQNPDATYAEYHSMRPQGLSSVAGEPASYYVYWSSLPNGQFAVGQVNYLSDWENYGSAQAKQVLEFPMELGTTWSSNTYGSGAPYGPYSCDGVSCSISASVNGEGTLILPSGTYTNVLRVSRNVHTQIGYNNPDLGTALFDENVNEYAYYQAGIPLPLMVSATYPDLGTQWSQYYEATVIGTGVMERPVAVSVSIYPTLATDRVSVTAGAGIVSGLIVTNSTGQVVHPGSVQRSGEQGRAYQFSVADLVPGMYHVRVMFPDGTSTVRKFVVAH